MTFEDITKCQEGLMTIPLKGKDYVMVNERVKAFRKLCPSGTIETELISNENGVCVIKARVLNEGHVLSTGLAYEKESSGFVNKTSYIENCETSAVGRALGFLGIGIDDGIASAEELANAVLNQGEPQTAKEAIKANEKANKDADKKISEGLHKELMELIKNAGYGEKTIEAYKKHFEVSDLKDLKMSQFHALKNKLEKELETKGNTDES